MKIQIRQYRPADIEGIKLIVKSLHPDWFDKDALLNIPLDVRFQKTFVAVSGKRLVGFITIRTKGGGAELEWIGVHSSMHGKGIGERLFKRLEGELRKAGVEYVTVETVGECTPEYEPYAKTRAFYRAMGFRLYKRGKLKEGQGYKHRMYIYKKLLQPTKKKPL
ncbi:MAG: GNAT family N-acetyltransferase [archaeon]